MRVVRSAMQRKDFAKAEELILKIQTDFKDKLLIQESVQSVLHQIQIMKAQKSTTK